MNYRSILHKSITIFIALIWIVNGLLCKVLNLVPRHQQIVAGILGEQHAVLLTKAIGVAEIVMALWIFSGIKHRLNALTQITVIAAMNIMEFILVPGLLLWGRLNIIFALIFIIVIYYNEFKLNTTTVKSF